MQKGPPNSGFGPPTGAFWAPNVTGKYPLGGFRQVPPGRVGESLWNTSFSSLWNTKNVALWNTKQPKNMEGLIKGEITLEPPGRDPDGT